MFVYVLMRKYRNDVWDRAELVSVYDNRSDVDAFILNKENLHPSIQPYEYWSVKKKIK